MKTLTLRGFEIHVLIYSQKVNFESLVTATAETLTTRETSSILVLTNHRTVEFYKYWYKSRRKFHGKKDQGLFNKIKHDRHITKKIGLTMKFLNTIYFRGLCQMSREMNKVCTMHANCCIGLQNKILDLRQVLGDWNYYVSAARTTDGRKMIWRSRESENNLRKQ
ncbi:unnamed protein product, partial [Thlaspi arvense]